MNLIPFGAKYMVANGDESRNRQHVERAGAKGHTYAAIDLGTNNCGLLIARPNAESFHVVDAFSRIVRLGEGLERSQLLSDQAMDRTIDALKICAEKMHRRKVTRARCVATAACRQARNCNEFLDRVNREAGLHLETITAEEEANLAVAACRPLLEADARFALVFDIGGGSTELTWVRRVHDTEIEPIALASLPHGVVNISEGHGGGEFAPDEFETLVDRVRFDLSLFETSHGINRKIRESSVQMIGTSGTVTTLSGVHLGLERYDRRQVDGLWLSFSDARTAANYLRAMSLEERTTHPCIGRGRADLVVAGCAILEAIHRTWPVERLRVADRGIRDGLLLALMHWDRSYGRAHTQP